MSVVHSPTTKKTNGKEKSDKGKEPQQNTIPNYFDPVSPPSNYSSPVQSPIDSRKRPAPDNSDSDPDDLSLHQSKMSKVSHEDETTPPPWFSSWAKGTDKKLQKITLQQTQIMEEQKQTREEVKGIKESMEALTGKITILESRIGDLETNQGSHVHEVSQLRQELNNAREALEIQKKTLPLALDGARDKNILIMGIPETEQNDADRRSLAEFQIQEISGIPVQVDHTHRQGTKKEGKHRPLVATLYSVSNKIEVLTAAKQQSEPGAPPNMKPDLCSTTRDELHRKWEARQGQGHSYNHRHPSHSTNITQGSLHTRATLPRHYNVQPRFPPISQPRGPRLHSQGPTGSFQPGQNFIPRLPQQQYPPTRSTQFNMDH